MQNVKIFKIIIFLHEIIALTNDLDTNNLTLSLLSDLSALFGLIIDDKTD